jgi:hypothetical protein
MIDELKQVIRKNNENEDISNYDIFREFIYEGTYSEAITLGEFTLECVDDFGGSDQGSTYWRVFSATKGEETRYYQLDGWYASYEGAHFDDFLDFYEVESAQKMVNYWRKK